MYTKNCPSVVLVCYDDHIANGLYARRSEWLITRDGIAGITTGPLYNNGRLFLSLGELNPDGLVMLTKDDQAAIAQELRNCGYSHLVDELRGWGYLVNEGPSEDFNKVDPLLGNSVQHQFDHPGQLASGSQRKCRIKVGDFETTFVKKWS